MSVDTNEAVRAAIILEDFVNVYGHRKEAFVDQIVNKCHRSLQQLVFGLFIELVKKWAEMYKAGVYDGRNEATCRTCNDIIETMNEHHKEWKYLPFV